MAAVVAAALLIFHGLHLEMVVKAAVDMVATLIIRVQVIPTIHHLLHQMFPKHNAEDGYVHLGGGGGGGTAPNPNNYNIGAGGSGIVIVRYAIPSTLS